ncbi:MAG: malto-oligosyltrehalose trehalohydrolase [Polyangiaceae bacterium]
MTAEPELGARVLDSGVRFTLFTTTAQRCAVRLFDAAGQVLDTIALDPIGGGYFATEVAGIGPGARYKFVLDERELPDPYARFLPDGVHGPAVVMVSSYRYRHERPNVKPLSAQVIYELHIGTFTDQGTYEAARERLPYLSDLGVTTLELLPLSSFPGSRGWGYDGVAHFAPFSGYGEPDELRRFVDEAHGLGLTVLLDVVYNHFGPAGNYLGAYSPLYFTADYQNAWGEAPRFADAPMRHYARANVLYWLHEFRFDGFRLDATHAIFDPSDEHVLVEIARVTRNSMPHALLFAEDERNDPACVTELGSDAIWADDFHHQLRATLTGEREGYYASYSPSVEDLARTIERGWLFEGQLNPHTGRARGKPADSLPAEAFVYCIQNHDQIGNRALGTRLNHELGLDAYCLASAVLLFLPMTPLLFMGQEWAASTPFLFFTDHDDELGAQITEGRRREFSDFSAFSDETRRATIPDPQRASTFSQSRLIWGEAAREPHASVLRTYRELLALRQSDPVLARPCPRSQLTARGSERLLAVRRNAPELGQARVLLANFGNTPIPLDGAPWSGSFRSIVHRVGSGDATVVPALGAVVLACDA